MQPKILVVDDEQDIRERLVNFISRKISCSLEEAADGSQALEKLKKGGFDLVLLDIKMPGLSGIDVMKEALKLAPQTKFLIISGYDSREVAADALGAGAIDYIPKPQTVEAIELKVREVLSRIGKYQPK
jgi:YesN/AraC family two-component response regulator